MTGVLTNLAHPLPNKQALALVVGACILVTLYCLAYNALAGAHVTMQAAIGWSLAMIAPWLMAWELSKRSKNVATVVAIIAVALLASMAIGLVLLDRPLGAFEIIRRLPALALLVALILASRWRVHHEHSVREVSLPIAARDIVSVRAAGNYVELAASHGIVTHRATLSAMERHLAPYGFIRIHRSLLVRRDAIARVRSEDVILRDGTHLPVGKRFRASLAA